MGKNSKKDRKPAEKGSSTRVAKELRDAAAPMIRLANSPVMSELIAAALIAGAASLAKSKPAHDAAEAVADKAGEMGHKTADVASLAAYSVAIAAGEIAARLVSAYEREFGGSKIAEQAARAARQAAEIAWAAIGKDRN